PRDIWTRLVACTLVLNFAAGIFSVSQEGAPYMYRTVAVVVPAFLVAGFGVQWLMRRRRLMASAVVLAAIGLNLYLYFGLDARNAAAMRVMGYELRQIGLEIARDDLPVYLVGADLLNPMEVRARLHEPYASVNPAVLLPP